MSKFRVCITRADGEPVYLYPGGRGERDLIEAVAQAVVAKGVGIFRTEAHVREAVITSFLEVLHEIKSEVVPG